MNGLKYLLSRAKVVKAYTPKIEDEFKPWIRNRVEKNLLLMQTPHHGSQLLMCRYNLLDLEFTRSEM